MVIEDLEIRVIRQDNYGNPLVREVHAIDTMPFEMLAANASLAFLGRDFHEAVVLYEAALLRGGLHNSQAARIFLANTYFELHKGGEEYLPKEILKKIKDIRIRNGYDWSMKLLQDEAKIPSVNLVEDSERMSKMLTSTAFFLYDRLPNIGKVWSNIDKSGIYQNPTSSELKRFADLMCTAMLLTSPPSSEVYPGLGYLVRGIKGFETNYSPLGHSQI